MLYAAQDRITLRAMKWIVLSVGFLWVCNGAGKKSERHPLPDPQEFSLVDVIRSMKRSIAPVVCATSGTPDWTLNSVEGTAFFVSTDGIFVTPNHVIDGIVSAQRQTPCPVAAIFIPANGWSTNAPTLRVNFYGFKTGSCNINRELDVAVCKPLKPVTDITPAVLETTPPPDGTPVAFTGFPLSNVMPITSTGTVAGYKDLRETGPETIIVDKNTWPGASGSPIYLRNGRVVGMLTLRGTGDGAGLTYGRTGKVLSDLLAGTAK